MKRTLVAAALVVASGSALANTGTIQFRGQINGATCPIDIVDPYTGSPTPVINLGTFSSEYFKTANRTPNRPFGLLIRDGAACGFGPTDEVTVTYQGLDGESPDYYLTKTGGGQATGVALVLQDKTPNDVKPGRESASYPVNETGATMLPFSAAMVSTGTVVAGAVDADVSLVVNLP